MKKEQTKEEELMKDLAEEAQWAGEDGDAVCVAKTKKAALKMFKELMSRDVGEWEADKIKIKDIGCWYAHALPEDEIKDHDYEVYFNCEKSPYIVYCWRQN